MGAFAVLRAGVRCALCGLCSSSAQTGDRDSLSDEHPHLVSQPHTHIQVHNHPNTHKCPSDEEVSAPARDAPPAPTAPTASVLPLRADVNPSTPSDACAGSQSDSQSDRQSQSQSQSKGKGKGKARGQGQGEGGAGAVTQGVDKSPGDNCKTAAGTGNHCQQYQGPEYQGDRDRQSNDSDGESVQFYVDEGPAITGRLPRLEASSGDSQSNQDLTKTEKGINESNTTTTPLDGPSNHRHSSTSLAQIAHSLEAATLGSVAARGYQRREELRRQQLEDPRNSHDHDRELALAKAHERDLQRRYGVKHHSVLDPKLEELIRKHQPEIEAHRRQREGRFAPHRYQAGPYGTGLDDSELDDTKNEDTKQDDTEYHDTKFEEQTAQQEHDKDLTDSQDEDVKQEHQHQPDSQEQTGHQSPPNLKDRDSVQTLNSPEPVQPLPSVFETDSEETSNEERTTLSSHDALYLAPSTLDTPTNVLNPVEPHEPVVLNSTVHDPIAYDPVFLESTVHEPTVQDSAAHDPAVHDSTTLASTHAFDNTPETVSVEPSNIGLYHALPLPGTPSPLANPLPTPVLQPDQSLLHLSTELDLGEPAQLDEESPSHLVGNFGGDSLSEEISETHSIAHDDTHATHSAEEAHSTVNDETQLVTLHSETDLPGSTVEVETHSGNLQSEPHLDAVACETPAEDFHSDTVYQSASEPSARSQSIGSGSQTGAELGSSDEVTSRQQESTLSHAGYDDQVADKAESSPVLEKTEPDTTVREKTEPGLDQSAAGQLTQSTL